MKETHSLTSVLHYQNWLSKVRESNKKYFAVLIQKKEWNSFSELARACGVSVTTISEFIDKMEKEGIVTVKGREKHGSPNKIIVNEIAWDYVDIWDRYRKLRYLFKEDIKNLLKNLSINKSAIVIGYKGNFRNRGSGLRDALQRLGWWDEFKKEGII